MKPFAALLCVLLSSCASETMDTMVYQASSGEGTIREETSTFDNTTKIKMAPANLYNGPNTASGVTQLGAVWWTGAPTMVGLVFSVGGIVSITGAEISVDGQVTSLDARSLTQFGTSRYGGGAYSESQQVLAVPIQFVQQMVAAKDVRLRVHTRDGIDEELFSVERNYVGAPAAKVWVKKFLMRVYDYQHTH